MELVSVCNNILQVILLVNNMCEDCLEILKREKMPGKGKKRKHYKEHLLRMERNAEISVTCLKGKESSHVFSRFFREDM